MITEPWLAVKWPERRRHRLVVNLITHVTESLNAIVLLWI